jgi:hypothetical protein
MNSLALKIVGGWDPRESTGFAVCYNSLRLANKPVSVLALRENALRYNGLYTRPHEQRNGRMWDVISDAPLSTSFANSRFLTPWLAEESDWALFCDFADMLFLAPADEIFDLADDRYAVMVVKHEYVPDETVKMDGQIQTVYPRKNWSSLILWNCTHPANARLTQDMVNGLPGRDLHRFCWLEDHEIGELPVEWNWLVGVDPVGVDDAAVKPKLLHYTRGIPTMAGYESGPHANVWLKELAILDATRGRLRS